MDPCNENYMSTTDCKVQRGKELFGESGFNKCLFEEIIAKSYNDQSCDDDPSPLILNKTQEYEGLGCVSNGALHTICAVGYIPPFHKIMYGTRILRKNIRPR